ncbi:NADP-dependent oxidoreductase domain-containing protein [Aspergillus pseudonomiae]|uniref:D-xylose reductase [NAD(P)H] n=1 Tax=Aspergillus pseudonomiae TaxID=1506151 RepID=A0A5N7CWI1_9EURO|nr:NADP-dependent oxidoreductase domain-containing protein [Aspergillus pseudonomiae]KAB8254521.1 NADP-dependent oxidoreductase domain-containing protein [Aspergillus pseudonomiae]KAE8397928.1 NADP-dependent oxidoreductase domain-containing protein [Aspergillus pseudonomiae]
MAVADTRFKLNTGAEIPALGLGTWQSAPGEVEKAVSHAISVGYRHIDGAFCYQNEEEVGKGIKDALASGKVKREDLFVTTKLWCTYHSRVQEALDLSLKNLGLDYIDLYLMHWPLAMNPNGNHPLFPKHEDGSRDIVQSHSHVQTWKNMEKLLSTGKVKAIGVSNYSVRYLEQLLPEATVVPAVNQIENHPSLPQQEIVDFCKKKGIHITAYSPLGSTGSPLFTAEPIVEVAKRKGVSPATVLLSWHVARGSSVLAKSVTPSRIEDNRNLVQLDENDMATIAKYTDDLAAKKAFQRFVYPPFGVDFGFPDKS